MISERQKQTFVYMLGATFLSAFVCSFFLPGPPLLFGLALVYSNKNYLKNKANMVAIPIAFFILFFITSGTLTSQTTPIQGIGICYLTFYAISIAPKIALKKIQIGLLQILLFLSLPVIALLLISQITNLRIGQLNNVDLPLIVFLYQFFMTLIITSMVKEEFIEIENKPTYYDRST